MSTSKRILELKPPRIALALVALAVLTDWLLPGSVPVFRAHWTLGAGLAAVGFVIMMIGWGQFRQRGVLICPTAPTHQLIQDGIYRWTRNPMYLGIVLMLFGFAAWTGALSCYVAAASFFLLMDRLFCPYEESKLRTAFGAEYVDYRWRTRRWF
jgi:protein-S-isoprenylcysteine O-methyltransferase Ste14